MDKEQFINGYVSRSNITREFYDEHFVALPCFCEDESCDGWASIHNTDEMIAIHMQFDGRDHLIPPSVME